MSDVIGSKNDVQRNGQSTQEYQVAMALELWRQQQEEHFNNEVESRAILFLK